MGHQVCRVIIIPSFTHCPRKLNFVSCSNLHTEIDDNVSHPSSPNACRPPSMQSSEPEGAQVEYARHFGSAIPPGAIPKFKVSTVTHPNLFGRVLNPQRCLIIRDDLLLGLVGKTLRRPRAQPQNAIPNQSVSEASSSTSPTAGFNSQIMHSNSLWSSADQPQAGPSSIPDGKAGSYVSNYPRSTGASGSRKILMDVQPGQGKPHCGAQYSALNSVVLDGSTKRRQGRSKDNRHQPYSKENRGTQKSKKSSLVIAHPIPSSTVPTEDDIAKAQASFRTLQVMECTLPVERAGQAQACGKLIDSAESMSVHLQKHQVRQDKRSTANSNLKGQCPLCRSKLGGGSIHRHLMAHFYHYICPVEGCPEEFTRDYEIRAHCNTHNFTMPGNEDFAVCK